MLNTVYMATIIILVLIDRNTSHPKTLILDASDLKLKLELGIRGSTLKAHHSLSLFVYNNLLENFLFSVPWTLVSLTRYLCVTSNWIAPPFYLSAHGFVIFVNNFIVFHITKSI